MINTAGYIYVCHAILSTLAANHACRTITPWELHGVARQNGSVAMETNINNVENMVQIGKTTTERKAWLILITNALYRY